jgi:hypothetical protein
MTRKDFLKVAASTVAAAAVEGRCAIAGPDAANKKPKKRLLIFSARLT